MAQFGTISNSSAVTNRYFLRAGRQYSPPLCRLHENQFLNSHVNIMSIMAREGGGGGGGGATIGLGEERPLPGLAWVLSPKNARPGFEKCGLW